MESDSEPDSVYLSDDAGLPLENSKVYISASRHGRGIFAARDIKKGELILLFIGKEMDYEESSNPSVKDYCVQIEENKYLAPSQNSVKETFLINHSYNPNTGLKGDRTIIAIRDIKKDEEIRFDYSTCMDDNNWTLNCTCGEKSCRGLIKDFRYLPKEIKEKYIKLGIVPDWILKRIEKIPVEILVH